MDWPTPQDYNEAIQNPARNLGDPELAAGTPELTPLGLPRPITGNFATVYRLRCGRRDWAVRCFWRSYADMQVRYAAISAHLRQVRLPYTVGFDYLPRGIQVRGIWFPVLKMEWVEGQLLPDYIQRHASDRPAMDSLAKRWLEMVGALESARVAHGDLQHGNVLVVKDELRLVDYDAMFVPALSGRGSHELGHQNYQHPNRNERDFGPSLDRASAWAIYLSILGVANRADLWQVLQGGDEALLFRKSDLLDPGRSPAFAQLRTVGSDRLRSLLDTFAASLAAPLARVPPLISSADRPVRQRALSRRRPRRSAQQPPSPWLSPSSQAPEWVREHMQGNALHTAAFSMRVPRLSLAASFAVLFALALFARPMGSAALAVIVLGAAVLGAWNIVLARFVFVREPAVAARRRAEKRWRVQDRKMLRFERRINRLASRQEKSRRAHDKRVARADGRMRSASANESRDLAWVEKARREILAGLDDDSRNLAERERAERAWLLDDVRRRHIGRRLHAQKLRRAKLAVAGDRGQRRAGGALGWGMKARLWMRGVHTAADVTERRIAACRDLGEPALDAIVTWRVEAELEARNSAPKKISGVLDTRVAASFAGPRRRLAGRKSAAVDRFLRVEAAIHERWESKRERPVRARDRAHEELTVTWDRLEQLKVRLGAEAAPERVLLARIERDLEPSVGFIFIDYVIRIVLPGLSG